MQVLAPEAAKPSSTKELLQAYWISPDSHGDFFWSPQILKYANALGEHAAVCVVVNAQ
jgi:hypothetical protein